MSPKSLKASERILDRSVWVVAGLVLFLAVCHCTQRVTIGAFNVRAFGKTKIANPDLARSIQQIVDRYDVVLLQEIRDIDGQSLTQLLDKLTLPFDVAVSERLGRNSYKEQYAFFYRTDRILLLNTFQYDDPDDVFEREPYTVIIAPKSLKSEKLALIGFHSKPDDAVAEIGNLGKVIDAVQLQHGTGIKVIVLGDLNAGCRYADYKRRMEANDQLTTSTSYTWLIGEGVDTTVRASTNCSYDRIIVQTELTSNVVKDSAGVFDFCHHLHLSETQCTRVSDHYPVEFQLQF